MKIKMRIHIQGTRDGKKWPKPGGTIDIPTGEAKGYIAQGYAKAVKAPKGEKAVKAPKGAKAVKAPKGEKR